MTTKDMNIIRKFCNNVIEDLGQAACFLLMSDELLNITTQNCMDEIQFGELKRQLISNPGAFQSTYYVDNTPDVKTVQEFLKKEMLNQLHERGLITKDEVEKLWPTK